MLAAKFGAERPENFSIAPRGGGPASLFNMSAPPFLRSAGSEGCEGAASLARSGRVRGERTRTFSIAAVRTYHEQSWRSCQAIVCARRSWRDPAGGSPAQVRGSAPLLASVASLPTTAGGEAYTAIVWGVGLSHEILSIAGAEVVINVEGNIVQGNRIWKLFDIDGFVLAGDRRIDSTRRRTNGGERPWVVFGPVLPI